MHQDFIIECRRRHDAGNSIEDLIKYLRDEGCSKIDSMSILISGCGIGLGEAKRVIHFSPTWSDRKETDDAFHATVEEASSILKRGG
jgi:hypothetical protein